MRVQLISDLHLERYPDYTPEAAPDADVLVLAGDIGSYQAHSRLADADFGLARFSPRHADSPWKEVLFIPGNHEFDGLDLDAATARLRSTCERLGLRWLEREVIEIGGVRFVGSTLWSDFDALARAEPTPTRQWRAREKAYRAANFYLSKNTTWIRGAPALADTLRELALEAQDWLRGQLHSSHAGPTVVVTHFAPSLRSADPRYGVTPSSAGFCNALDDLLPFASVWMHGHLHCPNDYTVEGLREGHPWACRVVANPRGYAEKGEQETFVERFVVAVPGMGPAPAA